MVHKRVGQPPAVPENTADDTFDRDTNGRVNMGSSETTEMFGDSIAQQVVEISATFEVKRIVFKRFKSSDVSFAAKTASFSF